MKKLRMGTPKIIRREWQRKNRKSWNKRGQKVQYRKADDNE